MNFVDLVKKSVINEFTGTISIDKIVLSLNCIYNWSFYNLYL